MLLRTLQSLDPNTDDHRLLIESFYRLLVKESIGLTRKTRNSRDISLYVGIIAVVGSDRLPHPRSELSAKPQDSLAKDLIESRIILALYFTIFLNQLDNLFPYTPNGTIRRAPG